MVQSFMFLFYFQIDFYFKQLIVHHQVLFWNTYDWSVISSSITMIIGFSNLYLKNFAILQQRVEYSMPPFGFPQFHD